MSSDYIDIFSRIARKRNSEARQEVVLLLTVIDLIEKGIITNNEIRLNERVESTFDELCVKYLHTFGFEVYKPFWYLSQESFWHIVPLHGKEDIIDLVKDTDQRPSKSKLEDSVDYVELDEDLYFLMTISSGRTGLKRSLISSCFDYDEEELFALTKDKGVETAPVDVSKLYESLKTPDNNKQSTKSRAQAKGITSEGYTNLPMNIKIEINLCFYSYLKQHPYEQNTILSIIPNIDTFYERIESEPIKAGEESNSFCTAYESLLQETKIKLISEDNAFEIVDKINFAINCLHDERNDGLNEGNVEQAQEIVENVTNVVEASSSLTDASASEESAPPKAEVDFFIEQVKGRSYIYNRLNEKIYSSNGRLILLGTQPYRIYLSYSHLTVNSLDRDDDGVFTTGDRIIDAKYNTPLYKAFNDYERINLIKKIEVLSINGNNAILFDGHWYDEDGMIEADRQDNKEQEEITSETSDKDQPAATLELPDTTTTDDDEEIKDDILEIYEPKGKIRKIKDYVKSPYDYLWMMSIIDMMGEERPQSSISIDTLALLMIANAWETSQLYHSTIDGVPDIKKCIEFYITESKEYMDQPLDWNSPKELVFSQIKDYPIGDDIEDVIDNIVKEPLFLIDNVWIQTDNMMDLVELSKEFYGRCLYGIHLRKHDSFIQMNPGWIWNLHNEHDFMLRYFRELYKNMLSDADSEQSGE